MFVSQNPNNDYLILVFGVNFSIILEPETTKAGDLHMSLFNESLETLQKKQDRTIENNRQRLEKVFKKFGSMLITEDTYTDFISDQQELIQAYHSMQPDKWSIPMEKFVEALKGYVNDENGTNLRGLLQALVRIPLENTEERLTASLEYFKAIVVKGYAIEYSDGALKFLANAIEIYLKQNPQTIALQVFIDKIDFIMDLISNSTIAAHPKTNDLISVMNMLKYRFTDYGYKQSQIERLGNFSEQGVANIAPIAAVANSPTMKSNAEVDLATEPGIYARDGIDINESMLDREFDTLAEEMFKEELGEKYYRYHTLDEAITMDDVKHGVSAATNKVVHVAKNAGRFIDAKLDRAKQIFNKSEKHTAEALKDSSFLDQKVESLAKVALKVGASIALVGHFAGLLVVIYEKSKYNKLKKDERNRIRLRLKEELVIVNEKINDYGNEGNKEMKYALMRMKMKIEKTIEALELDQPVDMTNDKDLKGFRVDEKRIIANQRKEKARLDRERDAIENSHNEYDD